MGALRGNIVFYIFISGIYTSKHFYDVIAHRYIQDNCQDMGMKFIRGLSADMDDFQSKSKGKNGKCNERRNVNAL